MFIGKKSLKALHGNACSDFYQPKCSIKPKFFIVKCFGVFVKFILTTLPENLRHARV